MTTVTQRLAFRDKVGRDHYPASAEEADELTGSDRPTTQSWSPDFVAAVESGTSDDMSDHGVECIGQERTPQLDGNPEDGGQDRPVTVAAFTVTPTDGRVRPGMHAFRGADSPLRRCGSA